MYNRNTRIYNKNKAFIKAYTELQKAKKDRLKKQRIIVLFITFFMFFVSLLAV